LAHDVFISYSSSDKATADAMCATLESRGIRCWIAPRDVLPGMDYGEALIDALNESKILVLIFSSNSNDSPQVMREVERAVSKGIAIIPFRIEDVPPSKKMEYFISSPHWLDALTTPLEMHLIKLADTIQAMINTSENANWVVENTDTRNKSAASSVKPQLDIKLSRNWIAGILGGVVLITIILIALNFNKQQIAVKTTDNKAITNIPVSTANQSNNDSKPNPAAANQPNNSSQPKPSSEDGFASLKPQSIKLRFYEGTDVKLPSDLSYDDYKTKFAKSEITNIFFQVYSNFTPPGKEVFYEINSILYRSDGTIINKKTNNCRVGPTFPISCATLSYGNGQKGGYWEVGVYKVEILIEGNLVASGSFEVY